MKDIRAHIVVGEEQAQSTWMKERNEERETSMCMLRRSLKLV